MKLILLITALYFMTYSAIAQNQNAGAELNSLQKGYIESLPKIPALQPYDIIPEEYRGKIKTSPNQQIEVYIRAFKFKGNTKFSADQLYDLTKHRLNKTNSFKQLIELSNAITDLYRSNGYFLAQTYIPKQSLSDQVLEFYILEGVIGEVKVQNDSKLTKSVIQDVLRVLPQGEVVHRNSLEQAILLLNDMYGIQAKSFLRPGSQNGETQIRVEIKETDKFEGYLSANNHSSYASGRYGLVGNIRGANLLRRGGNLDLTTSLSQRGGSTYIGLTSTQKLGLNDWSIDTKYNFIDTQTVFGQFKDLGISSSNHIFGFGLSKAFARSYKRSVWNRFFISREHYKQITLFANNEFVDKLTSFLWELKVDRYDPLGLNKLRFWLDLGLTKLDSRASDIFARGNYSLIGFDYHRFFQITARNLLVGKVITQFTKDRLLSVKQFAVGGSQRVRGFSNSEGLGEKGYVTSLEWQYNLFQKDDEIKYVSLVQPYIFFDHGRSINNNPLVGQNDNRTHQSLGSGLRVNAFTDLSLDVAYARRAGEDYARSDDLRNERIWGQLVYFYRF